MNKQTKRCATVENKFVQMEVLSTLARKTRMYGQSSWISLDITET